MRKSWKEFKNHSQTSPHLQLKSIQFHDCGMILRFSGKISSWFIHQKFKQEPQLFIWLHLASCLGMPYGSGFGCAIQRRYVLAFRIEVWNYTDTEESSNL